MIFTNKFFVRRNKTRKNQTAGTPQQGRHLIQDCSEIRDNGGYSEVGEKLRKSLKQEQKNISPLEKSTVPGTSLKDTGKSANQDCSEMRDNSHQAQKPLRKTIQKGT